MNGALSREYIYEGGQLIATEEAGASKYRRADHLSIRVTMAASGNVLNHSGHYRFGKLIAGASDTSHKFTGLERDSESGLDHTWFRQYSSTTGRWLSPDPLAGSVLDPQSLNRYAYVLNDPLNLTDPTGEQPGLTWTVDGVKVDCKDALSLSGRGHLSSFELLQLALTPTNIIE